MGRYLLSHGVHFILSEQFTQDPVKSFFGHQRQRGGGRDNPTAQQFMQATQAIRVQHSSKPVSQSNVSSTTHHMELDTVNTPVPKRRRMKQHTWLIVIFFVNNYSFVHAYICCELLVPIFCKFFSQWLLRKLLFCNVYCSIQPIAKERLLMLIHLSTISSNRVLLTSHSMSETAVKITHQQDITVESFNIVRFISSLICRVGSWHIRSLLKVLRTETSTARKNRYVFLLTKYKPPRFTFSTQVFVYSTQSQSPYHTLPLLHALLLGIQNNQLLQESSSPWDISF